MSQNYYLNQLNSYNILARLMVNLGAGDTAEQTRSVSDVRIMEAVTEC